MRGFHGSLESARAIMKGYEIYYNFVRKHQGINNKTPQEEAIPILDLGVNKWMGLIRLANQNFTGNLTPRTLHTPKMQG